MNYCKTKNRFLGIFGHFYTLFAFFTHFILIGANLL
nr:MAG TPA: hypothetical protein [Caudoviricetes sp.]